ncbi:MAG TPA: glutamine--fructose-6-phosphate transaminase (isomerizing), partial [Acidobacteriota bacterium]|nr:glutamine--fructose-6-phosphate transaminase (isomerizing) [Acidobacteriota bacterium]
MCGIVGYVGEKHVVPVLLDGLRKLEYRGYDSAGIAVVDHGNLFVRRAPGKLRNLETNLKLQPIDGTYGVGHTRWATHGRPSEQNAHPHRDASGRIVVVHNGVIENHAHLKQQLLNEGHTFVTQTDTEVIAHLIGKLRDQVESLEDAVRKAVSEFQGIYAIAVMSADEPDKIVTARLGPPIVIGLGNNEYFIASDIPAILEHTRDMFFLADQEMAVLTRSGVLVTDFEGTPQSPNIHRIMWDAHMVEKGGFRHYMLKEIYEQPRSIRDTLLGRVSVDEGHVYLDNLDFRPDEWREFSSIKIAACGTSWHAAMVGKFLIEELARIPVEVDYASEFRYRDPLLDQSTLTVVVTQSGETADPVAALREAKSKNSRVIAV